jgi:hypothetical protein
MEESSEQVLLLIWMVREFLFAGITTIQTQITFWDTPFSIHRMMVLEQMHISMMPMSELKALSQN